MNDGNESAKGVARRDVEDSPLRDQGVVIVRLAELPERALLDEAALAECLGVSKRTVRRMVGRHELPPPVAFGGKSMWQVGRVMSWFEVRAERAAREADRRKRRVDDRD